ncbi:hypothetical protein TSUD_153330 [Trifolium subterraneum]|uniref:NB-ARC domain-containing protein n=1 Tax=Trifolium subterraneum TaxID=3900 RepID=A0A2Z6MIC5_TRISU|nr:hypothetical protein TSUD_153330 [Trifolium subterraneum]
MCDPCCCCSCALSCAREHLLPLARKHLFPLALDHLLPILKEAVNMIMGVPNDVIKHMKNELETIEELIHQADKMADAEEAKPNDGTRQKIKQLIEAFFRIQDLIDEYIIREEQQLPDPGCAAGASDYVKTKLLRLQIAHDIQIIKSQINERKDTSTETDHGFQIKSSTEQGSSSTAINPNATLLQNHRKAPFYMEEADVVGFEEPRNILIDWLVKGKDKLTVVSVVAMGGQGKTTLARNVFDSKEVMGHFSYRVWITVSQSYKIEELLRGMLKELCEQQNDSLPQKIHEMNKDSLVDEVRKYLQEKRYVVVFDDVWNSPFWADIKFAMIDKQKGSRILITTRNMDVATSCSDSAIVKIHELKGLDDEQSLKLFNKKAFHDSDEVCPEKLIDISSKIVKKCGGLPLAIIVIAGQLSCKNRNRIEWYKFNENIKPKLKKDFVINTFLIPSYHDLSYNLKACLLYFGIYPEDYEVDSKRLIRQWIAEGFIKEEEEMTLEEVAEGYLTELIHRSLVQVVSINIGGRAKSCRVHDLVHDMILKKCEDLSFCKNISEDGQSALNGIVRHLSIATNSDNLMESIESSQVRSLLVPKPYTLHESVVRQITTKYRLLKVFDARIARETKIPEDLGSLSHLKYFSIKGVKYKYWRHIIVIHENGRQIASALPKSIGMLENLETLDLTDKRVFDVPKEICKLRKLRHFLGYKLNLVELKDGIGGMTSLQTLWQVCLNENDENIELIKELGKLKQLKKLGLRGVMGRHMSVLSSSINEMQQMEKLYIQSYHKNTHILSYQRKDIINLDLNLPKLQSLVLEGNLVKLPEWIPKHQNLVQLELGYSYLTEDPMKLLKSMPNLMSITLSQGAYKGEILHFQNGWFKNLKELHLFELYHLKSIFIDQGALPSLERISIYGASRLHRLPTDIQHLENLKYLDFEAMSKELIENILLNGGKDHRIFKQVPSVRIVDLNGKSI